MWNEIVVFSVSIVLGVVFQPSQGQVCPLNEISVECIDFCNTCESDSRTCKFICIPGCDCKPGFKRDEVGYCIPRRFCKDIKEIDNHGCPNVEKCHKSCTDRGFQSGSCIGPKMQKCQCHRKPKVEEENSGCPNNSKCNTDCRLRGFLSGKCTGVNNTICKCKSRAVDPPVDPAETDTVAESGICPSTNKCVRSCTRQGYVTGFCEGLECRCLNRNPPEPNRCNSFTCHSECIRRRYRYGACIGPTNVCRCYEPLCQTLQC